MTIAKRAMPANEQQRAWNRHNKRLPSTSDGSGCAHAFVIPTQPEPPLGKCRLCGITRMHSNTGDDYEVKAPWRAWNNGRGPANPERACVRLPAGYHLTGPVE